MYYSRFEKWFFLNHFYGIITEDHDWREGCVKDIGMIEVYTQCKEPIGFQRTNKRKA